MKDRLTPEQSQRLIELGVDPSKASMMRLDFNGTYAYVSGEEADTVRACVNAEYYVEECEIFVLSDILSLLPKEIYSEERDIFYRLNMEVGNFSSSVRYKHYGYTKGFGPTKTAPELIDALFELLVWCITNKHLKV